MDPLWMTAPYKPYPASPTPSTELDSITETPAAFRPDVAEPSHSFSSGCTDEDICAMLQAIPTKSDIEALILRIEKAHSCDMQEVKAEVYSLSERMDSGEALLSTLEHRVTVLERSQTSHADVAVDMQIHLV